MTAGDFLVEMPPHPLNRIRIRGVRGQVVQDNAMAPLTQIALHELAGMATGVVTDDMDLTVTQQATAQVLQMAHEQGGVAPLFGEACGNDEGARAPVERTREVALLVGAGR